MRGDIMADPKKQITVNALRTIEDYRRCRDENPDRYVEEIMNLRIESKGNRAKLKLLVSILEDEVALEKMNWQFTYFKGKPVVMLQAPNARPLTMGIAKVRALVKACEVTPLKTVLDMLEHPSQYADEFIPEGKSTQQ